MARQAFLVLGMHRSGTSAVARLLNLAGAAISAQLMPPQVDNPKGFWESLPITERHDQALARIGLAWDSIERVPDAWFGSADATTLRAGLRQELQADFPDGESFVMKDPRVCRFLPAWLQVLTELEYRPVAIMPVRNPLEVAQSLERRNGFPIAKSLLLWLRHVLDAEAATRQMPRAIIDYGHLLDDWRSELAEANRQLGFTCFAPTVFFEEQVGRFLSRDDRHHVASTDALGDADRHGWVTDAFGALRQLRGPADAATLQAASTTLDRIRGSLDGAEAVLEPFLVAYRTEVQRVRSAQATSDARSTAAEAEAARLAVAVEDAGRTLGQLRQQEEQARDATQRDLAALRQDHLQVQDELDRRQAELGRAVTALDDAHRDLDDLRQQSAAARQAAEQQRAEASRLRAHLDERASALTREAAENARLSADYASEREYRIRLQADTTALDRDREQLRRASDRSEREALRTAALGFARSRRDSATPGHPEALRRLLSDAQVPPSRWLAEPLRSARNLARLRRREYRGRVTRLARSGLFDTEYYSLRLGGVHANLSARFLVRGDVAGERTHQLFDPEWYRQMNPDIPPGVPLLQHYLTTGGWELRSPHPLFDPRFYLSQWGAGEEFGISPLSHFLEVGGGAGVSPHPLFDAFHYLRRRTDVAAAGVNPLLHYLTAPADDAADPHPLFSNRYYLECNPDVTGISALEHFVRHGAGEGRSPHPLFDVLHYWEQRPDVRAAGANALRHFLEFGDAEGIDPHPLFSCRHYQSQFGEPWDRRVNSLAHYLRWGRLDCRHPHPRFDTRLYLEAYPDVASSGMDPLIHYVLHGAREGRYRFDQSRRGEPLPSATRRVPVLPNVEAVATATHDRFGAIADGVTARTAHLTSTVTDTLLQVNHKVSQILQAQASQATGTDLDALGRQLFTFGTPLPNGRAASIHGGVAVTLLPHLERALARVPSRLSSSSREHAALILGCAFNGASLGGETIGSLIDHVTRIGGGSAVHHDAPRTRSAAEPGSTLIVWAMPLPRARAGGAVLAEAAHHLVDMGRTLDLYARAPFTRDDAASWLGHPAFRAVRLVPDQAFTPADFREWIGQREQAFEVVHCVGPAPVDLVQDAASLGRRVVYETAGRNTVQCLRELEQGIRGTEGAALDRIALELIRTWSAEQVATGLADVVLVPDASTATFVSLVLGPRVDPVCLGVASSSALKDAAEDGWDVEKHARRLLSVYGATGIRDLSEVE